MKESAMPTGSSGKVCVPIGRGLIVRAMGKDASENPMRAINVKELMLNICVGECGDRWVCGEKVSQQAEATQRKSRTADKLRVWPHRRSLRSQEGGTKSLQRIMEVISTLQKAIERLQEKDHQGGDRFHEHNSVVKAISAVVDVFSLSGRHKRRQMTFMQNRQEIDDNDLGVAKDAARATVQTSLTT